MSNEMLLKAADFAARKHRDQRRKNTESEPYINHPLRVARILSEAGVSDEELLSVALLHDTIEDTETEGEELEHEFSPKVRQLVEEVSDDKSLEKRERKRLQIVHAPEVSRNAALLKLADKISNLEDIVSSPPEGWSLRRRREYFDWAEEVVSNLPSSEMPEMTLSADDLPEHNSAEHNYAEARGILYRRFTDVLARGRQSFGG